MTKLFLKAAFIILLTFSCAPQNDNNNFQSGDLIFQTSLSRQCKAVRIATKSKYSHMGVIYNTKGKLYVYEAIQPVKITPLDKWIKRGEDTKYAVRRLKNANEVLTPDVIAKMKREGEKYMGKNYDLYFEWSDDRIYCSELAWKIYKNVLNIEIGELQKIKEFDLSHPTVREILKERYGDKIPTEELVISPEQMFNSNKLFTVYNNY